MDFDKNVKQLKWEIIKLGFESYKFIHPEKMPKFKYIILWVILRSALLTSQYQSNGRISWIWWNHLHVFKVKIYPYIHKD